MGGWVSGQAGEWVGGWKARVGDAEPAQWRALEGCTALKAMMERNAGEVAEARREADGWVDKHAKVGGRGTVCVGTV